MNTTRSHTADKSVYSKPFVKASGLVSLHFIWFRSFPIIITHGSLKF
jgi:hypothetical protein